MPITNRAIGTARAPQPNNWPIKRWITAIAAFSELIALKNSSSEPTVQATPRISSQLSSVRPPSSAEIDFVWGTLERRALGVLSGTPSTRLKRPIIALTGDAVLPAALPALAVLALAAAP